RVIRTTLPTSESTFMRPRRGRAAGRSSTAVRGGVAVPVVTGRAGLVGWAGNDPSGRPGGSGRVGGSVRPPAESTRVDASAVRGALVHAVTSSSTGGGSQVSIRAPPSKDGSPRWAAIHAATVSRDGRWPDDLAIHE